jgi:hypothetical protein
MAEQGGGGGGGVSHVQTSEAAVTEDGGNRRGIALEQTLNEKDMEHAGWLESDSPGQSIPILSRPPDMPLDHTLADESMFDDLPVFADDRSKLVNEEVKLLQKELEQTESGLKDNKERLRIIEEHLTNVQQEVRKTCRRVEGALSDARPLF